MAASPLDEFRLEDIANAHRIGAGLFIPLTIARLRESGNATEPSLTVRLRDMAGHGTVDRNLRLSWLSANVPEQPLAVADQVVTEWAALGVACAVLAFYTPLRIQAVTLRGDRFDYWLGDDRREYALEVSGTATADVQSRHRAKVKQWRDNPSRTDGFVAVVGFATREVILSFHRFEESAG